MLKTFRLLLKSSKSFQNVMMATKSGINIPIFINGKEVMVPNYYTIMQALQAQKITIPSFCYHERLSIAGNCRMCLVQVEGWAKPQIACGMPVQKNMKIRSFSEVTQKAQESVLEFILADHPLDCPVCDQGGECDLQDLTMRFGNDRSRFTDIHFEGKRAVEDKNMGPLIRTCMNRCIHCTRCIRFASQVCGLEVLGSTGRGHDMLVGTYVDKMFLSELSGNIIDLCPVGSLTSAPYMFKARPWEVRKANSIDVTDATGTNILINYRFDRVIRILPREHDEINQEWLSDKGRWAVDSTEIQRLVTPMAYFGSGLEEVEWDCALKIATVMINEDIDNIAAVAGPHTNLETLVTCKDFLNRLGSDRLYVERNLCYTRTGADLRAAYSLNVPMKDIPRADRIFLIGTNPRFEAPILNVWIREAYRTNECDIFVVGTESDYNYHVRYMGSDVKSIATIAEFVEKAERPLVFVGLQALETDDATPIMAEVFKAVSKKKALGDWTIINIVPLEASFCGALEVGYQPNGIQTLNEDPPKTVFLLGADDILNYWKPQRTTNIVYVGFQGDEGAKKARLVLPGAAYTEVGGTYMNMENRVQVARPAVTPPGEARSDWKIIRALAEYCGVDLPYSDEPGLACRMAEISPALSRHNMYHTNSFSDRLKHLTVPAGGVKSEAININMQTLKDYYCSDIFSSNSPTMIKAYKAAIDYDFSDYARN